MLNGRPPRSWAEREYRLVHWSELPRSGHFVCLEQSHLVVDVRKFLGQRTSRS
jgi:microsomal epoxide hydrolase